MAELRDDSILFSLKGLLDVEKQRVDKEAEAERQREQARVALERERERLRREAEEARRQAVYQAARLAEQRRREEEARLEALKRAELERARWETEARARVEICEQHNDHQRKLTELREETHRRRSTQLSLAGFALSGLLAVAGLGVYFGKLQPEARKLQVAYDELVRAERTRAEETKRLLERSEKKRTELGSDLEAARDRIATLEQKLGDAVPAPAAQATAPVKLGGDGSPPRRKCKDDGDPMDDCLR